MIEGCLVLVVIMIIVAIAMAAMSPWWVVAMIVALVWFASMVTMEDQD